MAKTGTGSELGTAEGALQGRAIHALFARDPVLDDPWAIKLLSPENRERILAAPDELSLRPAPDVDMSWILAVSLGVLRYADDEVERCAARGIDQYLILGAGFDTFALRRHDLADRVRVFEVDHPDVQALKRERVAQAGDAPAALPEFVPVDFETMSLSEGLARSSFDGSRRAVCSWMNTLPYLTKEATVGTLRELRELLAPGSRLLFNYHSDVPLTDEQAARLAGLRKSVQSYGEPFKSRWDLGEMEKSVEENGFRIDAHVTEAELIDLYFRDRSDGLAPGAPVRMIVASR